MVDADAGHKHLDRPGGKQALALVLALVSCVLFCLNGELLQALQLHTDPDEGHPSVLVNLIFCHCGGLVFVPWVFGSPGREGSMAGPAPPSAVPGVRSMSLLLATLLMSYNYCWLHSATFLTVSLTNAIFQLSIALVYIASVLLFGEPMTMNRMLGVLLALMGSAISSGGGGAVEAGLSRTSSGIALALMAAVGVTAYQVLFRHQFYHLKNDVTFLAYFGAWVSIWHIVVFVPLAVLAHFVGIEQFELPVGKLAIAGTLVSACIASTVNGIYLLIVMWGSPMLLPCSSALSVPLLVALDALFHGVVPSRLECIGHTMVVFSVLLIMDVIGSQIATKLAKPVGKGETIGAATL